MNSDLENFRAWYVDTFALLSPRRDSGIAIFMIALPLLERYLRQKNGLSPADNLNEQCMADLSSIFPGLANSVNARQFWNVYRNGFLHQATLSLKSKGGANLPAGWLTHDQADAVLIGGDDGFWVNPVRFAEIVVNAIEKDFNTFAGKDTRAPPLPSVVTQVAPKAEFADQPIILSTRGGR